MKKIKQPHLHKRPFLMMEVLIAFAIIALCAVPLIYPHVAMLKAQKEFINKVKINHFANLMFVNILEKLHKNEISLSDIENKRVFPIEQQALKDINGYKATYQLFYEKFKNRNPAGLKTHLAVLQLNFIPSAGKNSKEKTLSYEYYIFIASQKEAGFVEGEEKGAEDEDEEE